MGTAFAVISDKGDARKTVVDRRDQSWRYRRSDAGAGRVVSQECCTERLQVPSSSFEELAVTADVLRHTRPYPPVFVALAT